MKITNVPFRSRAGDHSLPGIAAPILLLPKGINPFRLDEGPEVLVRLQTDLLRRIRGRLFLLDENRLRTGAGFRANLLHDAPRRP